jgi:hypothetical protein
MVLRRALTRWQLFAIPVLPLWLLVGFGVFGSGGGFFLTFLGSGVLFVLLAVLAGLTRARPFVREHGAMNRADAAATVAFHLAVIGLGFFGPGAIWFGLAAVLLGLATFWLTALELVREWRERVSGAVARASGRAPRAGADSGENPDHTAPRTSKRMQGHGFDDGDVIIVHENGQ